MTFDLPDNHIFLKNPKRAMDFLVFVGELFSEKPESDYNQFKEILRELKRLPFEFKLDTACRQADQWQAYFPGVDIPKVIAYFASKCLNDTEAKKIYNHYPLIWNDLNIAEKNSDYPRGERYLKKTIQQEKEEIKYEPVSSATWEKVMAEIKGTLSMSMDDAIDSVLADKNQALAREKEHQLLKLSMQENL